jgi:hypothetical protein
MFFHRVLKVESTKKKEKEEVRNQKKAWKNKERKNKEQPNPLTWKSQFFTNWTLKLDPQIGPYAFTHTHSTLPKFIFDVKKGPI